jgi:hypothetical protein
MATEPTVKLLPSSRVHERAVIGAGSTIAGTVTEHAVIGQRCKIAQLATIRGHVGDYVAVGESAAVNPTGTVGDSTTIGPRAIIAGVVAAHMKIPADARIPDGCQVGRYGDIVTVGPVGSEGGGRVVTVVRQVDGHARIVAGCWQDYQGGTAVELVEQMGRSWDDRSNAMLYQAQYTAIIAMARALEDAWSVEQ